MSGWNSWTNQPGSAPGVVPPPAPSLAVVQLATAESDASGDYAFTFAKPTTAGNCIVVAGLWGSNLTGSFTSCTLGGSAGNFAQAVSELQLDNEGDYLLSSIWADPDCAGSETAVLLTASSESVFPSEALCLEVSGLLTSAVVDGTASQGSPSFSNSNWTSGSVTTSKANELWVGACIAPAGIGSTPPLWTNYSNPQSGLALGYQITSAAGTAVYTGTTAAGSSYAGCIATLIGATQ